jgi:hypothetical protein
MNAIQGIMGDSILGSKNRQLGPCNIYYRTSRKPNLTGLVSNISSALSGTVQVVAGVNRSTVTGDLTSFTNDFIPGEWIKIGTNLAKVIFINSNTELIIDKVLTISIDTSYYKFGTTLTGSGTLFQTELQIGNYISVGSLNQLAKVTAIASNTSLTLQNNTLAADANTFRTTNAIWLGNTDATTLRFSTLKAELKDSQYGDSPADQAVTGATCEIEAGLAMASLERIEAVTQGFENVRDNLGDIIGFGFGVSLGESDLEIADQLTLVRIVKGVETSNNLDIIHFPLAVPKIEAEATYDASTQRFYKTMFTAYRSPDHKSPSGRELFFYSEGMF